MAVEVWARNPFNYVREVAEARLLNSVWDFGVIKKREIDPLKILDLHYSSTDIFRTMIVNSGKGATELRRGSTMDRPFARYPVWDYERHTMEELEEMLATPVGDHTRAAEDDRTPEDERPVLGQEHRVVVTNLPIVSSGIGRKIIREIDLLQQEYQDAIIHVHNLYSYRVMFGLSFKSVDLDFRTPAAQKKVYLPNGKEMHHEQTVKVPQWITLLGYKPVDLQVPRNRCLYNIESARWAAKHFKEAIKFRSKRSPSMELPDPDALHHKPVEIAAKTPVTNGGVANGKDRLYCNLCSVQDSCKYYREGSVCTVPDSEPARLSRFFNTRDPDAIITGLGSLLGAQANRVERGVEDEDLTGELDPEVSKAINSLFNNGVKLAKLLNPELNGKGPQVGVFVGSGGAASVQMGSANQLTASIVAQLESKGIAREDITPEMIQTVLDPDATGRVLEAATVEAEEDD